MSKNWSSSDAVQLCRAIHAYKEARGGKMPDSAAEWKIIHASLPATLRVRRTSEDCLRKFDTLYATWVRIL